MITENIIYLKNLFNHGTVEDICRKYQFVTIYCNDGDKPFYENIDGKMVSNGAMIDIVVKEQLYTLFINGKSVKQGGDEISWELMKPFFDDGGIIHEDKFYSFDHAELIEDSA